MKKFAVIILSLLMIISATAFAKNVTVTGTGMTPTEAENDALRAAVENTLGVLVDSQTLVQNNMLINDQIYTQSRAFVNNYSVVSREEFSGGWRVTINATIDDQPNSKLMNELLSMFNCAIRKSPSTSPNNI